MNLIVGAGIPEATQVRIFFVAFPLRYLSIEELFDESNIGGAERIELQTGLEINLGPSYTLPDCYRSGMTFVSDRGLSYTTPYQSDTQRSD